VTGAAGAGRAGSGAAAVKAGSGKKPGEGEKPAYLVTGDDDGLVAQEAHRLLESFQDSAGDYDIDTWGADGQLDVEGVVAACRTQSLFGGKRVIVVRQAGRLTQAQAKPLISYLDESEEGTVLVLVGEGGTVPAALVKAAGATGEVVDVTPGGGRKRQDWLAHQVSASPVRLDAEAQALVRSHLGEDMGRLSGLLDALAAAYGEGASLRADQVREYLGVAGRVPPWELTDAIDGGDARASLAALARMLDAGEMHPLAVLSILHRHYQAMLRLDGVAVGDADQAARLLGVRSSFVAKKALTEARRLGSSGISQAVLLLAAADLDCRGATANPPETVLEVLVARLSRLGHTRLAHRGSSRRPTRRS